MPAFVGTSSVYVPAAAVEYVYFIVPYFAVAVGVFAVSPYVQSVIASGCVNSFVSKVDIFFQTAYSVVLELIVILPPELYSADVASLFVAQPRKLYPVLVGTLSLIVKVALLPATISALLPFGAFVPLFAS